MRVPRPHPHADGLENRDDHLISCLLLLQSVFGRTGRHDLVIQASWQLHTSLQNMTNWRCWCMSSCLAALAGIGQRRKTKEDKGKVSRPSSAKPFGSMDSLTVRVPSGSAVRSPPAAETPKAAAAAAQTPASAPAQLAASAPPDLVPAAAPLPPLGAATAAAVAAISKAGATPGSSPGAVAVTISAGDPQKDPGEAAKPPVGKPGPSRPPGIKADCQNGRRITTRYRPGALALRICRLVQFAEPHVYLCLQQSLLKKNR